MDSDAGSTDRDPDSVPVATSVMWESSLIPTPLSLPPSIDLITEQISEGSVSPTLSLPPQSKPPFRPRLRLIRNVHTVFVALLLGLRTPLSTPCQTDFIGEKHPPVTSCTFTALIPQETCLCLNPLPASTPSHVQQHSGKAEVFSGLLAFPSPVPSMKLCDNILRMQIK